MIVRPAVMVLVGALASGVVAQEPSEGDIRRLVADLGSEDWETRDRASAELLELGSRAEPYLEAALRASDAEVASRVTALRARWDETREQAAELARDLREGRDPGRSLSALLELGPGGRSVLREALASGEARWSLRVLGLPPAVPPGGSFRPALALSQLGPGGCWFDPYARRFALEVGPLEPLAADVVHVQSAKSAASHLASSIRSSYVLDVEPPPGDPPAGIGWAQWAEAGTELAHTFDPVRAPGRFGRIPVRISVLVPGGNRTIWIDRERSRSIPFVVDPVELEAESEVWVLPPLRPTDAEAAGFALSVPAEPIEASRPFVARMTSRWSRQTVPRLEGPAMAAVFHVWRRAGDLSVESAGRGAPASRIRLDPEDWQEVDETWAFDAPLVAPAEPGRYLLSVGLGRIAVQSERGREVWNEESAAPAIEVEVR